MALLASTIINAVRLTLRDPAPGLTWTADDLLGFCNQAVRNVCLYRPDANVVRGSIALVGGTLQALPPGGMQLIRLDENVISKVRCRLVDSALLDAAQLNWPALAASTDVAEYTSDPKDPKRFHVMPPNSGAGHVIALYTAAPDAMASVDAAMPLDDLYELPVKHAMLAEAFSWPGPRQDMPRANYFRQSFKEMLGMGQKAGLAEVPQYGNTPGGA